MNDTFVYIHRKPCDEVFYVGIGCEKRPFDTTNRNQFWHNVVNKYGYEVELVAEGLSWAEACELEKMLIAHYGRRDLGTGTLVNLTDGGEGAKGCIRSEEHRQKIRAAHKGKLVTGETRQKLSDAHKGKNLSKEHRQKLSAAGKGRLVSEETRQKLSVALSGENNPLYGKKHSIVVCPHCGKSGGKYIMLRWHFDNCKHKKRVPN